MTTAEQIKSHHGDDIDSLRDECDRKGHCELDDDGYTITWTFVDDSVLILTSDNQVYTYGSSC